MDEPELRTGRIPPLSLSVQASHFTLRPVSSSVTKTMFQEEQSGEDGLES